MAGFYDSEVGFDGKGPTAFTIRLMSQSEDPGCRDAALATSLLLGIGIALFASGLVLVNQEACSGTCEFVGLTMLYAGGPVSALIGVLTDTVVVAWPLEVMLWVILGFTAARWGARRDRSTWSFAIGVLALAVVYGLALSQLVELT